MPKLRDMVKVLRSKNAGPFTLTFDIIFRDAEGFKRATGSGVLEPGRLAPLLRLPDQGIKVHLYPPAHAVKVTAPRPASSGAVADTDVYGCQQHAPLLDLEIP